MKRTTKRATKKRATKRRRNAQLLPVSRVSKALLEAITLSDRDAQYTTSREGADYMARQKGNGGIIVQAPGDKGYTITTRRAWLTAKQVGRHANPKRATKATKRKAPALVKILGYEVRPGTKRHADLLYQKKLFDQNLAGEHGDGMAKNPRRKRSTTKRATKRRRNAGTANFGIVRKTVSKSTGPNFGRIVAKRPIAKKNPTKRKARAGSWISLQGRKSVRISKRGGRVVLEAR